jgi:hypothetical protein
VNWYVDGNYLSSSPGSSASAWEYYWDSNSVANGTHTISVAGFDSSDNRVAQPSLTVNVQNSGSSSSSSGIRIHRGSVRGFHRIRKRPIYRPVFVQCGLGKLLY